MKPRKMSLDDFEEDFKNRIRGVEKFKKSFCKGYIPYICKGQCPEECKYKNENRKI